MPVTRFALLVSHRDPSGRATGRLLALELQHEGRTLLRLEHVAGRAMRFRGYRDAVVLGRAKGLVWSVLHEPEGPVAYWVTPHDAARLCTHVLQAETPSGHQWKYRTATAGGQIDAVAMRVRALTVADLEAACR